MTAQSLTAKLGLDADLPLCVYPNEPWVEYGIVEHRYKLLRPDIYYGELLPRYSHTKEGPKPYTVSAFIAGALGRLCRKGTLAWSATQGTGYWQYDTSISSWALPPGPPNDYRLTWLEYAESEGLDPADWDLEPTGA